MATIADHKYVWKADYAITTAVISAVLILVGLLDPFTSWHTDGVIRFLLSQFFWLSFFGNLAFAACDVLGFKWAVHWGYIDGNTFAVSKYVPTAMTEARIHFDHGRAAYRWIQHLPFVLIMLIVAIEIDFKAGLGMFILWWTGFPDWLYYLISKSKFGATYSWLTGWVWIFPMGAIWKLVGKPMPKWAFFLNVILGLAGWVLLGVL